MLESELEEDEEDMDFEDDYENELAEYNYDECNCICVDCLLDYYTQEIQGTMGCSKLIREYLEELIEDLDMIK
jgi:hypothetical protein